ncbi:MAG: cytochrome c-type biogenesis protein [Gammaproteobacteria bacterium]
MVVFALGLLWVTAAFAATAPSGPNVLPPKLEQRYQEITSKLRCPVCQNESIAVSDSVVSKDLRNIVRKRLLAGESDQQIRDYMISRYGLFAVYNPPVARGTLLLWFGPVILFLIAAAVAVFSLRRRRRLLGLSLQPGREEDKAEHG